MVTLDIPKDINKELEHFKIEHELKDKRDAIVLLLKQSVGKKYGLSTHQDNGNMRLQKLFDLADKTKEHTLTSRSIKQLDKDIYG